MAQCLGSRAAQRVQESIHIKHPTHRRAFTDTGADPMKAKTNIITACLIGGSS
jgi:hypothetical protein